MTIVRIVGKAKMVFALVGDLARVAGKLTVKELRDTGGRAFRGPGRGHPIKR